MKAPVLNPVLTGKAVRYMASLPLAATRIAPILTTALQSAQYYVYDTSNLTDVPTDIRRAPSAPFARGKSRLSDDTFFARDYGFEEPVDNSEIALYGGIFPAERSAMERAVRIVAVNHEIRVRNMARAVPQTGTPSTKWNAGSGTSIIADVKAAKNAIHAATGVDPNLMVIPRDVYNALEVAPELLERYKYTEGGNVTLQQMRTLFGVEEIMVTNDQINNAAEGQEASLGGIWTDEAFLCYSNAAQDIKAMTFARTFNWSAMAGSGPKGISTYTYTEDPIDSRVVRARQFTDEKVIASGAAYYLSNVLS